MGKSVTYYRYEPSRKDEWDLKSVRFEWEDGAGCLPYWWSNTQFLLAEALRRKYSQARINRVTFRAEADTEDEYNVTVDVLIPGTVKLYPIRKELRKDGNPERERGGKAIPLEMSLYDNLDETDKKSLDQFCALPLDRRIAFWQEHIAPLCE